MYSACQSVQCWRSYDISIPRELILICQQCCDMGEGPKNTVSQRPRFYCHCSRGRGAPFHGHRHRHRLRAHHSGCLRKLYWAYRYPEIQLSGFCLCTPTHTHTHREKHRCVSFNCYIARADGAYNYLLHLCVFRVCQMCLTFV